VVGLTNSLICVRGTSALHKHSFPRRGRRGLLRRPVHEGASPAPQVAKTRSRDYVKNDAVVRWVARMCLALFILICPQYLINSRKRPLFTVRISCTASPHAFTYDSRCPALRPADLWRVPGSAFKADGRREASPFDSACGAWLRKRAPFCGSAMFSARLLGTNGTESAAKL